jgi:glutamine synthetase
MIQMKNMPSYLKRQDTFIGGILDHAKALAAIVAPYYKFI